MSYSTPTESFSSYSKVSALETSLNQSVVNFQDLVLDLQQLHIDSENHRLQYLSMKEKCENKTCSGAEELKKVIATKEHIIQAVASTLTKLNETKDFNILSDVFKILFQEIAPLTPPTDDTSPKSHLSNNGNKAENTINKNVTPSEEESSITEDVSYREESSEIEGTPTGRVSPIIQTRKTRSILARPDIRDKKKCPDDWPTSEPKAFKLIFPTSSKCTPKGQKGKLRQSRLNLVSQKNTTIVDLTCSPEVLDCLALKQDQTVQTLIKKESIEDDTILPSPTSGPTIFTLFKTSSKASPSKFKKPKPLSLKSRCENVKQDENKDTSNNSTNADMDESINILNQFANRIRDIKKVNSEKKYSPVKKENCTPIKKEKGTPVKKENVEVLDEDATNASITLQDFEKVEEHRKELHSLFIEDTLRNYLTDLKKNLSLIESFTIPESGSREDYGANAELGPYGQQLRPSKLPLAENINITNTPPKYEAESSMSILRPEPNADAVEAVKRRIPELAAPLYKEPAVRTKAEKRNLQGWSCEECMNFYGVLYKDDPVMLAKKIQDCSKHRGRHNPARPKTPPNFWNPRWTVPEDTEELNRMNNAS